MGRFIKDREFTKVMAKPDCNQLYKLAGDHDDPPVLFIDEIENIIFKFYMSTPYNVFYTKEKLKDGT